MSRRLHANGSQPEARRNRAPGAAASACPRLLRLALGDLATHRCVRRIGLPPLSAEAVAVLAGGSSLDPAALHRLTGGNLFYVSQAMPA